ncbi:2'-5' RNA ligase family protein [Paracoccus sp. WLY502]|uniref:2'-5' RNA ligase family protein n=1 Tax=Paracoccus yibinensis TaxID=3068891 RepID=UPI0027967503|nr:2'-5' RNA ligase family protein [Paracoccus sp. WLY502]MDQ1899962.1 2'-5' RNA ligase family protein [Paracoccus sp. WLY502]
MADDDPLILTAWLDDRSFDVFQTMRQRHFPPARNHIPAHLTLFHHLPGAGIGWITQDLQDAARNFSPMEGRVSGLRFLGRGVAYDIDCPGIERLRDGLSAIFSQALTPQDRQRIRPHVTIQNKVAPSEARALFDELSADFRPFPLTIRGLLLWHYRGGPWDGAGRFRFGAPADA